MKIKILYLCLFCFAISFSCKKDNYLKMDSTESLMLSQILIDKTPSFEYTYNSAKFINEEKSKFAYSVNHYNDLNQLVTVEYYANFDILSNNPQVAEAAMNQKSWFTPTKSNQTGNNKFEYNDKGQLVKTIYTPATGSKQSSQFSYNEDENINDQRLFWEDTQIGHIEYLYDFAGNLVEEILFTVSATGGQELNTTTVYDYDNKQNPYKHISRLMTPGVNTNVNNITMETQTIHLSAAQGGDIVVVTKNSYKYNTSGYPISKNGNVEYIYQY
jgi:hypothetical protein